MAEPSPTLFRCMAWTGETRCHLSAERSRPFDMPEFLHLCVLHLQELESFFELKNMKWAWSSGNRTTSKRVVKSSVVYFMQRSDGCIKIGFSTNVGDRVRAIESSTGPINLLATVPGGLEQERKLHETFAYCRVHGEWFNPDSELLKLIENVNVHQG